VETRTFKLQRFQIPSIFFDNPVFMFAMYVYLFNDVCVYIRMHVYVKECMYV